MSDPILTICVPVGPGHEDIANRAKDSVRAQTVPVRGDAYYDTEGKGAGYARNQLLARVQTPYVAFLDADDYLLPEFAERMLQHQATVEAQGKYTYSGYRAPEWDKNSKPTGGLVDVIPPDECYCPDSGYQVHLISALFRTEWAQAVGGFDESLPGSEDTDFFMKLHVSGHCGVLLPEILLFWDINGENRRGKRFYFNPNKAQIMQEIIGRYPRENMSCCGGNPVLPNGPAGERQNGDIQARVLGPTFIVYVGKGTGRVYENVGYGQIVWASPLDVDADPTRFQRYAPPPPTPEKPAQTVTEIAEFMQNQAQPEVKAQQAQVKRVNGRDIAKMAGFKDE